MGHGPYNIVQRVAQPMTHGKSIALYDPWGMDHTMVLAPHGAWVVQWYCCPMGHGLCNGMDSHGSWIVQWYGVVQQYRFPIPHGLHNGMGSLWVMGWAMIFNLHPPWVMQFYALSMFKVTLFKCEIQCTVRATLPTTLPVS